MKLPPHLARYTALHASIERQLTELQNIQENHYGTEPDSVNWGHVGTLAEIDRKLRELREFLGCTVEEDPR